MSFDTVILGGGPAAFSAALTLRARNKTVCIVTGGIDDIPLDRGRCHQIVVETLVDSRTVGELGARERSQMASASTWQQEWRSR